jgi:hypothetical protein
MPLALRFLLLVFLLNIARYLLAMPLEMLFIFDPLFGIMAEHKTYFNTSYTTTDWITSYLYNFMMWFTAALVFHLVHPVLNGSWLHKSLKSFGLMYLFFASVSAIHMNHYSHPKTFYIWILLDAVIAFGIVAIANALLYPRLMGRADAFTARSTQ